MSPTAAAPDQTLTAPHGAFTLLRHPVRPRETLRAWDAADEYLLTFIATELADVMAEWTSENQTTVVVNDTFGALATGLAAFGPAARLVSWSDSFLAHQGLLANLERNGCDADAVELLGSSAPLPDRIDMAVIKVPKSKAQLEHQLRLLRPRLHADSVIIAGGMVKQIHTSTLEIFERVLGATHTSLARKKARLVFCDLNPELAATPPEPPVEWTHAGHRIINHPGVFSSTKLDIGTRFFLGALPSTEGHVRILDLGCGNGIVGVIAAAANPDAELIFVDESYAAVASAQATFEAAFPNRHAHFVVAHDLATAVDAGSVDLVLSNPPFHQNNALGDAVAWDMFQQSRTALSNDGELWVVGNRHLNYHIKLQRIFGNCETVSGNPKFVVLQTRRANERPPRRSEETASEETGLEEAP